jgi:Family of unknown function (DUF5683)
MRKLLSIFLIVALHLFCGKISAQVKRDSVVAVTTIQPADTSNLQLAKKFNPRIATRRSAMLPGWGQIYNKKYWKLPLVYGALGVTAGVFVYNVKNYKLLRLAYIFRTDKDSTNDGDIDPKFKNLSTGAIQSYRNSFRQNVDYSVLFFIAFWGLNVLDATVDAQLKAFDVNDNLSLQLKHGYSPMANTTGISLVFDIHPKKMSACK